MSVVDDVRTVAPDMIAPDLNAINVRLEELEKRMNLRFKQAENLSEARYETMLSKLELATAAMAANHDSMMRSVDLDRRMQKIELGLPGNSEASRNA